jgi:hypothetical protein
MLMPDEFIGKVSYPLSKINERIDTSLTLSGNSGELSFSIVPTGLNIEKLTKEKMLSNEEKLKKVKKINCK